MKHRTDKEGGTLIIMPMVTPGKRRRPISKDSKPAQVYSLEHFRNCRTKTPLSADHREKLPLPVSPLEKLRLLIEVYREHMLTVAEKDHVQKMFSQLGICPREKIRTDVEKLYQLVQALNQILNEKGAENLGEAARILRFCGTEELNQTLDQVLNSNYVGFRQMAELIAAS